ncbi:hypothetical protein AQUSIP_02170 [Aquicella siphonis]|uniref:Entericidin A n=1 Tax=Aquicella siphonis TaxID=254247 RepID=A0A5E4PEU3_9COXI|nr:entericidin A/B family lipoprotein [Aquicella siphonis]VVC74943.1 hypothetical protein AQUSIP_02170 [Aquicella siphonis]
MLALNRLKLTKHTLTLLFAVTALLSGCNTVQGVGKDLQQGGAALQQAADEHS